MPTIFGDSSLVAQALMIIASVFAVATLVYGLVFCCDRCKWVEISPGFFTPVSVTFGLIIGFLASQIWADNTKAISAVMREASALKSIVLISDLFPSEVSTQIHELTASYIDNAVNTEWPKMQTSSSYYGIIDDAEQDGLKTALSIVPTNEPQVAAKKQLIDTFRTLYEARSERLLLSGTSVNGLRWLVVSILAFLLLLISALVHKNNPKSALLALTILSTVIASSYILIVAHDRPFTGYISITPDLLVNVKVFKSAK